MKDKKQIPPPVSITEAARNAINEVIKAKNVPENYCVRVGVQGGACAGVNYIMAFDEKKENDIEYDVDGLKVIVERGQSMYILGMEIDWYEDEAQRGFVFNNPTARKEVE